MCSCATELARPARIRALTAKRFFVAGLSSASWPAAKSAKLRRHSFSLDLRIMPSRRLCVEGRKVLCSVAAVSLQNDKSSSHLDSARKKGAGCGTAPLPFQGDPGADLV